MKKGIIHIGLGNEFECDECGKQLKIDDQYFWVGLVGFEYVLCFDCLNDVFKQANLIVGYSPALKDIEKFNKSTIKSLEEQDADFLNLNRKIGL